MKQTTKPNATKRAHDSIREFENLQPGWLDGTGGPTSPRAAGNAHKLITLLGKHVPSFYLFPTADHGINLEAPELGEGVSAEITLEKDGNITLFAMRHGGDDPVYIEGATVAMAARFASDPLNIHALGEQLFQITRADNAVTVANTQGAATRTIPASEALLEWAFEMDGAHVTRQAAHPELREVVAHLTKHPN